MSSLTSGGDTYKGFTSVKRLYKMTLTHRSFIYRLKDSRIHVLQMEKMLHMLEEVQNIKRAVDQKLQETEDEALELKSKVGRLERVIKELYASLLLQEETCKTIISPNIVTGSSQISPAAEITENFNNEADTLQKRMFLVSTRYMGNVLTVPLTISELFTFLLQSIEDLGSEEFSGTNKQKER